MRDNESNVSTPVGDCPSNDELAAFLESSLIEPRHSEVRRHVLACPDCYEIYADAHRFEVEVTQEPVDPEAGVAASGPSLTLVQPLAQARPLPPPPVSPPQLRKRRRATAPLTMAAGLVLATVVSYQFVARAHPSRPEPFVPASWTGQISQAALAAKSRSRGISLSEARHQAALQGDSLVDLTLALTRGRHSEIDGPLGDLTSAARAVAATEKAGVALGDLRARFGAVTDRQLSAQELAEIRGEAEKVLAPLGPDEKLRDLRNLQDFGQWREAGRLAAKSRDPRFFESGDNRRFLAWLRGPYWGSPSIPLSREGLETLQKIATAWPDPVTPQTSLDYPGLEAGFDRLTSPASLNAP